MMARELLSLLGLNINWILEPAANCFRTGNHLGIQPHAFKEMVEFFCDDIEEITGIRINPSFNRKGAEILFVTPSGDVFADPGTYTMMGYLMLFEHIGLDYTLSTYASEGGNFGLFTSSEMMKRLNAKMYAEAKRLGVKWILGGECGHMWRVINQYMDTMNGPADFLEVPKNPITGTEFTNCRIHQNGPYRRIYGGSDQTQQIKTRSQQKRWIQSDVSTIPATRPGPWACWTSPGMY